MGLFDNLRCDVPLPDARVPSDAIFQTKSLYNLMDSFTITRDGRLVHHKQHWKMAPSAKLERSAAPLITAAPAGDVDTDFHGDIRFGGSDANEDYVARFTNGTLEWIKPYKDLSELLQTWFFSKD